MSVAEFFARSRRYDDLVGSGKVESKKFKNSRIFSRNSLDKFATKYGDKALKDKYN
jgi:hypothetical protein